MDKKLRDEWVAALRSGEYAQTRSTLQYNDSYCCLGVLCRVGQKHGLTILENGDGWLLGGNLLPQEAIRHQLRDAELRCKLMDMNDDGSSFPEIADWIEANIPVDSESNT